MGATCLAMRKSRSVAPNVGHGLNSEGIMSWGGHNSDAWLGSVIL
jgi:hypothetical protein